jgi:hemolysin activation/secretion protein
MILRALLLLVALVVPGLPPATAQQQAPAAGAGEDRTFDVFEFLVEGNSALPPIEIERAVYPFLGPDRTVKDVENARAALERAYQQAGFPTVLVDIPEQKVDSSIVVLRVTEGKVDRLRITGNLDHSRGELRSRIPALAEGTVPYFPDVQDQLAALQRGEDLRVTPVLRAGGVPGTVEVELKVEDRLPLHGTLELNNRYSFDTEPLRLQGSIRYTNLWQRGHTIGALFVTSPQDTSQVKAYSANYSMPVRKDDLLVLYAIRSDSNVATIGGINTIGRGKIYGTRYVMPLPPPDASYRHTFLAGVDYKDFQDQLISGNDNLVTPISYLPFLLQYSGAWPRADGETQFSVGSSFSFRGLVDTQVDCGGQPLNEFACKRFGADAGYILLRAEATDRRALGHGFELWLRATAQLTNEPLVSNEQFPIGGADSVRGYVEFDLVGDSGISGTIEVRSPQLLPAAEYNVQNFRLHAFVDAGNVRVNQPLPGQSSGGSLSSAGAGFRVRAFQRLNGNLDVAFPFGPNSNAPDRTVRVLFRVAYEF